MDTPVVSNSGPFAFLPFFFGIPRVYKLLQPPRRPLLNEVRGFALRSKSREKEKVLNVHERPNLLTHLSKSPLLVDP